MRCDVVDDRASTPLTGTWAPGNAKDKENAMLDIWNPECPSSVLYLHP